MEKSYHMNVLLQTKNELIEILKELLAPIILDGLQSIHKLCIEAKSK